MQAQRTPAPKPAVRTLQSRRTLVIGHRGAAAVAPENTLPSFAAAVEAGVDLVEFDIRCTRDGVPVVVHDAGVARTTDAPRLWIGSQMAVAQRSLDELRALDAGSWKGAAFAGARIPTLGEAVDAIRPRAVPLIERKAGSAAAMARTLSERSLVNEVIVIAFDWRFLREMRRLLPGQVLGALGPPAMARRLEWVGRRSLLRAAALDRIRRMGIGLVVWNDRVSRASINAAHARGMRVWVYTVNDPGEAVRLADMGVDGIITDDPALVRRTLARHR